MNELGMDDITGQPASDFIPPNFDKASKDEKRQLLKSLAEQVVNKYILGSEKVASLLEKVHMVEVQDEERKKKNADARFKCKFPGCEKTYKYDGKRKREHETSHGLSATPVIVHKDTEKKIKKRDDMFNYQSSFLEIGLLVKNFFRCSFTW